MKSDRPLTAVFSGILSALLYEVSTCIFLFLEFGKYSLFQLDGLIITADRIEPIIGLVISCLISALTSILFYLSLKVLNSEHLVLKSIIFSLLVWAFLEIIFTGMIEGKSIPFRPIDDYYIHLLGAVIYGLAQGLLFRKLLFNKHSR